MNISFKKIWAIIFLVILSQTVIAQLKHRFDEPIRIAAEKYKTAVNEYKDSMLFPRSTKKDGSLNLVTSTDWCSGFFPGSLWLLYDLTKDKYYKDAAMKWTRGLGNEQYNKTTHDLGFMMYCSFGNGYKLTGDTNYKNIVIQSAKSLATRFHPKVGVIRSWDFGQWQYPVIIDNMMNLELLFEASKLSGDNTFRQIAIKHADHDMQNHFRKDFSSYHLVDYDTLTGKAIKRQTVQGFANESSWARGQSWGLYGFTVMYRYTKDKKYLNQAEHIASFILNNPNYPKNGVPYWDFNDPKIPNTYRDASAAAVIASALLELRNYVNDSLSKVYFNQAVKILTTLSSDKYFAKIGNCNFLLKHCVGNLPKGEELGEIDAAINYADYYYLEALLRYMKISGE